MVINAYMANMVIHYHVLYANFHQRKAALGWAMGSEDILSITFKAIQCQEVFSLSSELLKRTWLNKLWMCVEWFHPVRLSSLDDYHETYPRGFPCLGSYPTILFNRWMLIIGFFFDLGHGFLCRRVIMYK